MLSNLEIATIRAALRYWLDEIVPSAPSVAAPYLDDPPDSMLDRQGVLELIDCFESGRLRHVVTDAESARITFDRLLTAGELSVLRESWAENTASHTVHTVVLSRPMSDPASTTRSSTD